MEPSQKSHAIELSLLARRAEDREVPGSSPTQD